MAYSTTGGETDPLLAEALQDDNSRGPRGDKTRRHRLFAWGALRFHMPSRRKIEAFVTPGRRMDAWCSLMHCCMESFVYLLGPILICLASSIIGLLVYTYFTVVKDMLWLYHSDNAYAFYIVQTHTSVVVFLLINVVYNYALCVCTSNIKGKSYNKVMREMAAATGFSFPESPAEVEQFRKDYEDRMLLRMQCRRHRAIEAANRTANGNVNGNDKSVTQRKNASNGTVGNQIIHPTASPAPQVRPWMIMGPLEWGFCSRTKQPKPPRAHYCHVSKGLVFCLDHYCPWMFNSVGYFNYRYFVNFLIFACVAMLYGASLTYTPFLLLSTSKYREQLRANKHHLKVSNDPTRLPRMEPFLPYPHEKMYITLTFMLSLAVGLAVAMLCFFHIYLVLSSQTTIEFHGNMTNARRAKKAGKKWKNPYSFGTLRNFEQVYGSQYHPLLAILIPSSREPEFLPIPMSGDQGKRSTHAAEAPVKTKGEFVV